MARVRLVAVNKQYPGGVVPVDHFCLEIPDKEFLVLVGPSGCGKSTLLRMIAGLEEVTSGEIYLDERLINRVPPKDRNIAMVFQNYALYPHMTVHQNIAFSLRIRHIPPAEIHQRVLEVARALGIEDLLQRKPKALSGGQRQRAALGRAMIRQPNLFLFDEPLSNLDAKLRSQMRAEIKRLHQQLNATFIYVTHDQVEAMTMADRMVVMQDGRIEQVGTSEEIYLHPANLFVAGFVGSPQMNFFPVRLTTRGDMLGLLVTSDAFLPLPQLGLTAEALELVGRELTAGIRPECVEVTLERRPTSLFAEVEFVENLGREQLVHCSLQGEPLVARTTAGMILPAGATVGLLLAAEQIHLFDPASQLALQLPARRDLTPLGSSILCQE